MTQMAVLSDEMWAHEALVSLVGVLRPARGGLRKNEAIADH